MLITMGIEKDDKKEIENWHSLERPDMADFRKKYQKLYRWLESHYASDYKIVKKENKNET